MFNAVNNICHQNCGYQELDISATQFTGLFDESIYYETDEFRMYGFKIKICPKTRSHDWTLCPFAHRGEKARRRDPRKIKYAAIACPDFRNGYCKRGEDCQFAHGIFEFWLHPAKYRTRACNATGFCQRKVCFFAHSPSQLRPETKYKWHYNYRVKDMGENGGSGSGGGCRAKSESLPLRLPVLVPVPVPVPVPIPINNLTLFDAETEFRRSLTSLNVKETNETPKSLEGDITDLDFPNIEWITELVE